MRKLASLPINDRERQDRAEREREAPEKEKVGVPFYRKVIANVRGTNSHHLLWGAEGIDDSHPAERRSRSPSIRWASSCAAERWRVGSVLSKT